MLTKIYSSNNLRGIVERRERAAVVCTSRARRSRTRRRRRAGRRRRARGLGRRGRELAALSQVTSRGLGRRQCREAADRGCEECSHTRGAHHADALRVQVAASGVRETSARRQAWECGRALGSRFAVAACRRIQEHVRLAQLQLPRGFRQGFRQARAYGVSMRLDQAQTTAQIE